MESETSTSGSQGTPPRSAGGSSRGERRRKRTEDAIVAAAEGIFLEHGYRGARIEAIAERADVAVGSIYGHFGGKDGLYAALTQRSLELFDGYMAAARDPDLRPIEQLLATGDAYMRLHIEHPGAFRFIALSGVELQMHELDQEIREQLETGLESILGNFEEVIAAGIAAGEIRGHDPHRIMTFLWGAWNGVAALSMRDDRLALGAQEVAATLELGRRIVTEGLAVGSARAPDGSLAPSVRVVEVKPEGL